MIKFGPSGSCEEFLVDNKHTKNAPMWIRNYGLDCMEYSFGRGVCVKESTAKIIGQAFADTNIEISVHAPYYINLASCEEEKVNNNYRYIFDSLKMLKTMGGNRCVFHPGSPVKNSREKAMTILLERFEKVLKMKDELGYNNFLLCPETMGKKAQLGNLEEIIAMCNLGDKTIIPCIDWGHLNSRDCGILKGYEDYQRIVEKLMQEIGEEKTKNMHVHFSKIQYTGNGELRHLTFDDTTFGPDYEPLMQVFCDYKMTPYVVCESAGTQSRDALRMKKDYYNKLILAEKGQI